MPKVTASSSSSAAKKAQVVPTGHGKKKNERKEAKEVVPFDYKNYFHCKLYEMLKDNDIHHIIPTERNEASYQVCYSLFKATYSIPEDDIHGHMHYYEKIVSDYIGAHGMPKKWSDLYPHGLSEIKFQQNVDLNMYYLRNSRRSIKEYEDRQEQEVNKIAEENGISQYDAFLKHCSETPARFHENVTLTFNHPSLLQMHSLAHTVTVKKDTIIGDVLKEIPFFNKVKAFFLKSSRLSGSKLTFFGYDYDLSKPFSEYPEAFPSCGVTVLTAGEHAYGVADHAIMYPMMYFNEGKSWPPEKSCNWDDGDPINLAPFLIWNGWGNGPINVPMEEDNHWYNLVVLRYPNGVTKVVNFHAWVKIQREGNLKDALSNQELDRVYMTEQLRLILAENANGWTNKLLPVMNLKFQQ